VIGGTVPSPANRAHTRAALPRGSGTEPEVAASAGIVTSLTGSVIVRSADPRGLPSGTEARTALRSIDARCPDIAAANAVPSLTFRPSLRSCAVVPFGHGGVLRGANGQANERQRQCSDQGTPERVFASRRIT
jgi:hypothetical protein